MSESNSTHDQVKQYYGQELASSNDLKTNACCADNSYPKYIKEILKDIHEEVLSKFYGCGLTIPQSLLGTRVLDLGSGSGRDCYLISKLVGQNGSVTGVDMTEEQLDIANKFIPYHTEKFRYQTPNVDFISGNIEKLEKLNLQKKSFDVIVSNCVINLAIDKKAVLEGAFNLLKQGGELYFSDVYADRRIPSKLREDPVLYGECLSGALYWNDFLSLAKEIGFRAPRMVESRRLTVDNNELEQKVGDIKFYSITYRLFKIDDLEYQEENYGQSVSYNGELETTPDNFTLDHLHDFPRNEKVKVSHNTFQMLYHSRFKPYFSFSEGKQEHLGSFEINAFHYPVISKCSSDKSEEKAEQTEKTSSCC